MRDSTYTIVADTLPRYAVAKDTEPIPLRKFNADVVDRFADDDDFRYGRPKIAVSPWERFIFWIQMIFFRLFYLATQTLAGQIVFYSLCGLLLIWVILRLLKIDAKDLFYGKGGTAADRIGFSQDELTKLNIDEALAQAIASKNFREGVRLLFLKSLRQLVAAGLIRWLPGKTNDAYLQEVRQHPVRPALQQLRYYFDYASYGHFEITEDIFRQVHKTYHDFSQQVK